MSDVLFQGPFPAKCVVGHVFANSWPHVLFLCVNTGQMCWGSRSCQNCDFCGTHVLWVSTTRCKSQMYCTKTMERLDACVADPRYVGHRSHVLCVCPDNTHGHMCCKHVWKLRTHVLWVLNASFHGHLCCVYALRTLMVTCVANRFGNYGHMCCGS